MQADLLHNSGSIACNAYCALGITIRPEPCCLYSGELSSTCTQLIAQVLRVNNSTASLALTSCNKDSRQTAGKCLRSREALVWRQCNMPSTSDQLGSAARGLTVTRMSFPNAARMAAAQARPPGPPPIIATSAGPVIATALLRIDFAIVRARRHVSRSR